MKVSNIQPQFQTAAEAIVLEQSGVLREQEMNQTTVLPYCNVHQLISVA